ncbi:site-specific integrase [Lactobacillus paracasei subsp. paracasei]|uniref:site-specific integrase n=1 Tax=Lacticaseibacillus paracasei TaxID=1597 RepID=UPI0018C6EB7F|nr:site-specific integrase [Lacticaseibacillus paracasei]MBG1273951.1 site-specific integrase [Lacticaseibacillus paracasei subsp. paracasei]
MKRNEQLFHTYFKKWIETYKHNYVTSVTYRKWENTERMLKLLAPQLKVTQLTRRSYQQLLSQYAETHEHQTCMDFHHQLKCVIQDILDEGLIKRDPTLRAVIGGTRHREHKIKFLQPEELEKLLQDLNLGKELDYDYMILLLAKTGLRFAEALGLTPADFDFDSLTLRINKTWDYKSATGKFAPTKNKSSVRTIAIDYKTAAKFAMLIQNLPKDKPIFVPDGKRIYNETINDILKRHCENAGVPVISAHGLRHTHASLLIGKGINLQAVAKRLGHSSSLTTQKVYIHLLKDTETSADARIGQLMAAL